jgi:hypothetical protein
LSTRDTVWCETPASFATSRMTVRRGRPDAMAVGVRRSLSEVGSIDGKYYLRFPWKTAM